MAFTLTSSTGYIPVVLTLADATKFEVGGPISGDGVGGNDGVGTIIKKDGNDVTVKVTSGTFVAGNAVDDNASYNEADTTISTATPEVAVIFERIGVGAARGVGLVMYMDYTLNGDSLEYQLAFKESALSDEFFDESFVVSDIQTITPVAISATGLYRFPVAISDNEDAVKITFTGGVDGTMNVEFRQDQGNR